MLFYSGFGLDRLHCIYIIINLLGCHSFAYLHIFSHDFSVMSNLKKFSKNATRENIFKCQDNIKIICEKTLTHYR